MPNPTVNVKQEPNPAPISPSNKRKAPPSSSPNDPESLTTSSPSSPSKQARPNDPRHKFYGSVQKSGAWTTEEDKKLFQPLFPKAVGVNWEVVARDIEGRSLHSCMNRSNTMKKMVAKWLDEDGGPPPI